MPDDKTTTTNDGAGNATGANASTSESLLAKGLAAAGAADGQNKGTADGADKGTAQTPEQIAAAEAALVEKMTPEQKSAYEKMTPEQKASHKAEAAKAAKDAEAAQNKGAPDKYQPFKAPEGMTLDEADVTAFTKMAKDYNLSQDKAQALIDLAAARTQKLVDAERAAGVARETKVMQDWKTEISNDKEFGGANLEATLTLANRAITKFAGDEPFMVEALKKGWGNNPAFIRTFARIGKAMNEDKTITGTDSGKSTKRSAAEVMYDGK